MNPTNTTHFHAGAIAASALLSLLSFAAPVLAADGNAPAAQVALNDQAPSATKSAAKREMDRDELRIKGLHDKLKITPEQEVIWSNVAQTMRSNDDKMDALAKTRHDNAKTMSAVEDLRSYGEITEAHATGIKTFVPAFEKLYDSMSPAQKANADDIFRNVGRKTDAKTQKKAM